LCRLRNAKPYSAEPFGQISKALAEHFAPPVAVVEADEPNAFAIKPPMSTDCIRRGTATHLQIHNG